MICFDNSGGRVENCRPQYVLISISELMSLVWLGSKFPKSLNSSSPMSFVTIVPSKSQKTDISHPAEII
jgi:hypothetical protein